jgi:hypothetical protein
MSNEAVFKRYTGHTTVKAIPRRIAQDTDKIQIGMAATNAAAIITCKANF